MESFLWLEPIKGGRALSTSKLCIVSSSSLSFDLRAISINRWKAGLGVRPTCV